LFPRTVLKRVRLLVVRSEEERRWLAEAVEQHMMVDVVSRMREIALLMSTPPAVLEAQGITHDDIEGTGADHQWLPT
jgi:hypothetical protein